MWLQGKKLAQGARLWAAGLLVTPDDDAPDADVVVDEAAAALGLQIIEQPEDAIEPLYETFYLWPCNVPVWNLWWRIQSQWRISTKGREGLDYAGVTAYLRDVVRIRPRRFEEVFAQLQAMERAALDEWDKQRALMRMNQD